MTAVSDITSGQISELSSESATLPAWTSAVSSFSSARARRCRSKYHGQPVQLVAIACLREARTLLEVRAEPAGIA